METGYYDSGKGQGVGRQDRDPAQRRLCDREGSGFIPCSKDGDDRPGQGVRN
ncbi:hypothetical protein D3C77_444980 [compost metagenome]